MLRLPGRQGHVNPVIGPPDGNQAGVRRFQPFSIRPESTGGAKSMKNAKIAGRLIAPVRRRRNPGQRHGRLSPDGLLFLFPGQPLRNGNPDRGKHEHEMNYSHKRYNLHVLQTEVAAQVGL